LVRQVSSLQLRIEQMQCAIVSGRNDITADEVIRLSSEHRRLLTSLKAAPGRSAGAADGGVTIRLGTTRPGHRIARQPSMSGY
jgi:hypothetical protein